MPTGVARYRTQLYPAHGVQGTDRRLWRELLSPSVHIIVRAMQKAGTTTDAFKIRQAVPLVVPLEEKYDATGLKTFTEEGEGVMAAKIGRVPERNRGIAGLGFQSERFPEIPPRPPFF